MFQLWGQEVLLSRNPSRSCGHLSHTGLPAREQGEGKSYMERKTVKTGTFCSLSVCIKAVKFQFGPCFLFVFVVPAAFSNTPPTLSTPLSSGSRWEATSHCTLHSSVCRRVSFTHAFHFSAACIQSEEASYWTAESYRTWVWWHVERENNTVRLKKKTLLLL